MILPRSLREFAAEAQADEQALVARQALSNTGFIVLISILIVIFLACIGAFIYIFFVIRRRREAEEAAMSQEAKADAMGVPTLHGNAPQSRVSESPKSIAASLPSLDGGRR